MTDSLQTIDAMILCGGLGTRLRGVGAATCKPMVEVCGKPFLARIVEGARAYGLRRFIFCIGHKGDDIRDYFTAERYPETESVCVLEEEPLGTGGALHNAAASVRSGTFFVFNGDSFAEFDAQNFLQFHHDRGALVSMLLCKSDDCNDYGLVSADTGGRIQRFDEKTPSAQSGYVNAGVYLFERSILAHMPAQRKFSLEKEFFPSMAGKNFFGYAGARYFLDIGTPQRLARAREFFAFPPALSHGRASMSGPAQVA